MNPKHHRKWNPYQNLIHALLQPVLYTSVSMVTVALDCYCSNSTTGNSLQPWSLRGRPNKWTGMSNTSLGSANENIAPVRCVKSQGYLQPIGSAH